jgi:hypothetical protein
LLQGIGIFTDPAAARAGQIAQMSRLKHQHEREFIVLHHFILDDVAGKIKVQFQRETHYGLFLSIILLCAEPSALAVLDAVRCIIRGLTIQ